MIKILVSDPVLSIGLLLSINGISFDVIAWQHLVRCANAHTYITWYSIVYITYGFVYTNRHVYIQISIFLYYTTTLLTNDFIEIIIKFYIYTRRCSQVLFNIHSISYTQILLLLISILNNKKFYITFCNG